MKFLSNYNRKPTSMLSSKSANYQSFCSDPIMWGTYFTLWKQDNWLDISWLRMATRTIHDDYAISIQVATTCNMVHANLHTSSLCITTVHHNRLSLRNINVYCQIIKLHWRQAQSMWSTTKNLIIPRNIPFLDVLRPHIYLATRCYKWYKSNQNIMPQSNIFG